MITEAQLRVRYMGQDALRAKFLRQVQSEHPELTPRVQQAMAEDAYSDHMRKVVNARWSRRATT